MGDMVRRDLQPRYQGSKQKCTQLCVLQASIGGGESDFQAKTPVGHDQLSLQDYDDDDDDDGMSCFGNHSVQGDALMARHIDRCLGGSHPVMFGNLKREEEFET